MINKYDFPQHYDSPQNATLEVDAYQVLLGIVVNAPEATLWTTYDSLITTIEFTEFLNDVTPFPTSLFFNGKCILKGELSEQQIKDIETDNVLCNDDISLRVH